WRRYGYGGWLEVYGGDGVVGVGWRGWWRCGGGGEALECGGQLEVMAWLVAGGSGGVDWSTEKMRENNFIVSAMHGDMPQKELDAIME
ncbi:hypothetical protein Tco_1168589, partial [Tanacetum coccineum]